MVPRVGKFKLVIFLFLLLSLVDLRLPWALDPKFDLDIKDLGVKERRQSRDSASAVRAKPGASSGVKGQQERSVRKNRVTTKKLSAKASVRHPKARRRSPVSAAKIPAAARHGADSGARAAALQKLRLTAPSVDAVEVVSWARTVWKRFFASENEKPGPFQLKGANYSLSLDPAIYPVLPAVGGGKILLDTDNSLSPLVKTILQEKEPDTQIVTESPSDPKKFFAALFSAAGFYSVVENFSVGFGSDPRLTVSSDFKIEKTHDSLLKNNVVLLNLFGRRTAFPAVLRSFLEKDGFEVVDVSPVPSGMQHRQQRTLYSITDGNQTAIVDALLEALSVPYEKDKDIPLQDGSSAGVTLSVKAERYYEKSADKVVVFFYQKDRVQDVLLKLLKQNGYQVVILQPEDDFREIAEKVLSAMKLPATYGFYQLWNPAAVSYGVQLSGFIVPEEGKRTSRTFLTNSGIDTFFKDLVASQGYTVVER